MSEEATAVEPQTKSPTADSKAASKTAWYRNTYFWIAGASLLIGIFGLLRGDDSIRDPGQREESYIWAMYLAASVLMLINGLISHRIFLNQLEQEDN